VAIRPTDIQGAIWQAVQTAPLNQRAQEAPREAQAAAQAAFAAQVVERQETIDEAAESLGNRVDANAERDARGEAHERDGKRRMPFEDVVDEAAGFDEPRHLIDFTA